MDEKTELHEVKKPLEVTVKISPPTARRLFAMAMQAQGAGEVAEVARAGAEAAVQAAQKLGAAYQQSAYLVLESKHDAKLPENASFQITVDVDENKLTFREQRD